MFCTQGTLPLVEETRTSNTLSNCALYEWHSKDGLAESLIYFSPVSVCFEEIHENSLSLSTFVQRLEYFTVDSTLSHAFFF